MALLLKGIYVRNNRVNPVLGINHPSRTSFYGISNKDWNNINGKLHDILIKKLDR